MFIDRQSRLARIWSNSELRKFAPLFEGDIINISGWDDRDKEGGHYSEYFVKKTGYYLTNYSGFRGYMGEMNEFELDLTKELPKELHERFDVVFNHTTLEHIFDVNQAFQNLCLLSRDIIIIVVPFSQIQHESESYGDYWRFTPSCLKTLCEKNSSEILYLNFNHHQNSAIYILCIASKKPERWRLFFPAIKNNAIAGEMIGITKGIRVKFFMKRLFNFMKDLTKKRHDVAIRLP